MRVAMVGLGDIAQKAYLPVVANHAGISPIVCTRKADVLTQVQRRYRIDEGYRNIADVIGAAPDLVTVHSSTECHYELVKRCLQAGIPVFVDKPISYHYRECAELVDLAVQKGLPLMVGFNRRYAPLYQLFKGVIPRQLHYQKHRINLPAEARFFVFDDFIHVLDFAQQYTQSEIADIEVFAQFAGEQLASLQVQWQADSALFVAAMDRLHGRAEERLRFVGHNEHWEINDLAAGHHYRNGETKALGFNDWEPTLAKRGFVAMVDHMLEVVQHGQGSSAYENILATHKLCEDVVTRVEALRRERR
jgi:virulence factor